MADKVIIWIKTRGQQFLAMKVATLVEHMALSKEPTSAIRIARELLRIQPDPNGREKQDFDDRLGSLLHPSPTVDLWQYEQFLKELVPPLVNAAGLLGVKLFAELLDEALTLSRRSPEGVKPHDNSYIWRPAVEEHEQNRVLALILLLATAVRDAEKRSLIRIVLTPSWS